MASNLSKITLGLVGITALTTGGVVVYASRNEEFRNKLENYIPQSKIVMDAFASKVEISDPIPSKLIAKTKATVRDDVKSNDQVSNTFKNELLSQQKQINEQLAKQKNELDEAYKIVLNRLNEVESLLKDPNKAPMSIPKVLDSKTEDVTAQLKRQLAAHHDYLTERLNIQKSEIERNCRFAMEENLITERLEAQAKLKLSFYRLNEIESLLKARMEMDKNERNVRDLWKISLILKDALYKCEGSDEILPKNLNTILDAVNNLSKKISDNNQILSTALDSLKNAERRNVYSEDDLIKRFRKVANICRRVAIVDDKRSLFQYILSYMRSVLLIKRINILNENDIVNPKELSTETVIENITKCLELGKIEMALRYANQLRGEPRKAAKDWIKDLRNHLELKQIADIIQAFAAGQAIRTVK